MYFSKKILYNIYSVLHYAVIFVIQIDFWEMISLWQMLEA